MSRGKKEDKPSTALDYQDQRKEAIQRLKTQGATEILKHNFEEEHILNGNQIIGLNEQAALEQMSELHEEDHEDQIENLAQALGIDNETGVANKILTED